MLWPISWRKVGEVAERRDLGRVVARVRVELGHDEVEPLAADLRPALGTAAEADLDAVKRLSEEEAWRAPASSKASSPETLHGKDASRSESTTR